MCGGNTTSTSQTTIPQNVLDQYNSVNQQAEQTASTPFQSYSSDPSAFVAPLTDAQNQAVTESQGAAYQAQPYYAEAAQQVGAAGDAGSELAGAGLGSLINGQNAAGALQGEAQGDLQAGLTAAQPYNGAAGAAYGQGIGAAQPLLNSAASGISSAASAAQPYNAAATGLAAGSAGAVNATPLTAAQIQSYESPYLNQVLGSTEALQNQENQEQQSGQLGTAIQSGAFGGDRAGIAGANLAQQQQLANENVLAGIANTGYNTGLTTAEGQQGVNLSASQANRAALGSAGSEIASIGNQGYTQGLGAATAQEGLGSTENSLYSGLGTNLQGLGSTVYGQNTGTGEAEAALGNQEYQQGLSSEGAEAGLGSQLYGQGLSSAQENAALGTGAQTAAEQGASGLETAGAQAQTTNQAGLTALYNQYLQQQSYPFQVDQFLANIAEGTGSLSGSTTSTTQPTGFFSDERLKEGVKTIGKTFDGMDIVKYRYKGDPMWRVGLIAQDVEKRHPDAVGESQGYKVVDYGEATKKAAERGRFYRGGLAANDDVRSMAYAGGGLATGTDGYGPYQGGGSPYQAGSSPYGGAGIVPSANVQVRQLLKGNGPPIRSPTSIAQQAQEAANFGDGAQKDYNLASKGVNTVKGWLDKGDTSDDGLYARGGLATGGDVDPYSDTTGANGQPGLDIPDQTPAAQGIQPLGAPNAAPKPESGAKDAIGAALDVAKIAAMFAKRGGAVRRGYDDGGDVAPDTTITEAALPDISPRKPDFNAAAEQTLGFEGGKDPGEGSVFGISPKAHPDVDMSKLTRDGAKDIYKSQYWDKIGADKMSPDMAPVAFDTAINMGVPTAQKMLSVAGDDPQKLLDLRQAKYEQLAAENPAKYAKNLKGWMARVDNLRSGLPDPAPAPPPPQGLGVATPDAPPPATGLASAPAIAAPAPANPQPSSDSAPPAHHHGFLEGLTETKNLVPLLSALGAMGSYPTHSFGAALAAGLAGGAKSLAQEQQMGINQSIAQQGLGLRAKEIGISQQQADTGRLSAIATLLPSRWTRLGSNQWRDNVTGSMMTDAQHAQSLASLASTSSGGVNAAQALGVSGGGQGVPPASAPPSGQGAPTPTSVPAATPQSTAAAPVRPPATPEEAIYNKVDQVPAVAAYKAKADDYLKQADALQAQAQDPSIVGLPVAQQYAERANNLRTLAQQQLGLYQTQRQQYAAPEIGNLSEGLKAKFVRENDTQQQAYTGAVDAQNTLSQANTIAANLKDQKTGKYLVNGGPAGEILAKVGQLGLQAGLPPDLVKAITGTDPNDAAAVQKMNAAMSASLARQDFPGGVRVSEWANIAKNTPSVDQPAAAADFILHRVIIPHAQQQAGLYEVTRHLDPLHDDIQGAAIDYLKAHPWATSNIGAVSDTSAPQAVPRDAHGNMTPSKRSDLAGQPAGSFVVPAGDKQAGKILYWPGK